MRTNTNSQFIFSFNNKTYNVQLVSADVVSILTQKPSYSIYINNTPFGKLIFRNGEWKAPQLIPSSIVEDMIRNVEESFASFTPLIVWN